MVRSMASKKTIHQLNVRMSPTEMRTAQSVARKLGLTPQNAIRYLLKREHDAQTGGQNA
jgi:antitoxin component of RelBE/YafQ-DinJ toxin-antitoxin module